MRRIVTMLWMVASWTGLTAQTVEVGLFQDHLVRAAVVYCSSGHYQLLLDGEVKLRFEVGDIFYLTHEEGRVKVLDAEHDFGFASHILLRALSAESVFRVRTLSPEITSRQYDDNLLVIPEDRYMTLVNQVDMDKYLAGVVEAESGPNAEKEFYKAQSILCRTFAMKQMDRHLNEGFALCDRSHCQAYKGKRAGNPQILEAIVETSAIVLADYNFKLISAAYHANSGGQTQRAADVWLSDVDYLQSVVDPYSLHQSHAKWQDTISFKAWKDYLLKNGMKSVTRIPDEIIYIEQMKRKKYFILDKDSIRMAKIREDWGFKSSFFDMFPDGDHVLVWGKGFGHGIGMSQEGAMKMARDGFSYQDILKFYFHEVRIMDYRDLPDSSLPESLKDK
ncbi:MAG: SpoIID/LytB domain-containing protein [Bacteroidales bacterium]|nr:SpoIID/LytB domain-containing protein [Bacteroidales bacterium]